MVTDLVYKYSKEGNIISQKICNLISDVDQDRIQRRRRQSGWSGQGRTTQVVGLRTRRLGQVSHTSSSLLSMHAFLVIVPALSSVRLAFYARRHLALCATCQEHLPGCLVFYTSVPPPLNRAHARVIFYLQWPDHFSNAGAASGIHIIVSSGRAPTPMYRHIVVHIVRGKFSTLIWRVGMKV